MLLFWSYSRSRSEALCPFIGGLRSYLDPVDYFVNLGLIIEELQKRMSFLDGMERALPFAERTPGPEIS